MSGFWSTRRQARRPRWRGAASAVLALALAGGLAACTGDNPLADQYKSGDNKGFVAGDFQTKEIAPADRGQPVTFSGTLDTGDKVSNADYAGDVLVVNFWYAQCGPCRAEAPRLEKALGEFAGKKVSFLGVNTRDQAEGAQAFAKTYSISYPSILAADDGQVKYDFSKYTPLSATPTTIVLDKQGRVAARIVGELPDASVLTALVRDALGEKS